MKRVAQEFSRFANDYNQHNIIQREVAKKLLTLLSKKEYKSIVDIGCGSGEIYKNIVANQIEFMEFTGVDISNEMLKLHPSGKYIRLIRDDFDRDERFDTLQSDYDVLLSSSAIQWSSDLDATLRSISLLSSEFYLSIFTAGTFQTLHEVADMKSPIYSKDELCRVIDRYFIASYETIEYRLYFDTTYDMLRYIKKSGTSGGERRLGYSETKRLIDNYPLNYLEFEVLFFSATRRKDV